MGDGRENKVENKVQKRIRKATYGKVHANN
jgi:hypothetical protein